MKKKDERQMPTYVGGQAVIEGVMMRGKTETALAMRRADGSITVEKNPNPDYKDRMPWLKWPMIRGVVNFIDSMVVGVKYLMISAETYAEDDPEMQAEEPSRFEKWLERKFGDKIMDVMMYISLVFSLVLGVGLFMLLPTIIAGPIKYFTESRIILTTVESLVKMAIFLLYMFLVSRMRDIHRVFEYHGAEHKSICCYEKDLPLTVENVRECTRFHPRCGTSFLVIVMIVSIVLFALIPWSGNVFLRVLFRLLLLPVVAGVSYEFIRWAGRSDNALSRALSKPGLWLQRLTTYEPDDSQIEVALEALKAVISENREDDRY